jgi:hypothetical protein
MPRDLAEAVVLAAEVGEPARVANGLRIGELGLDLRRPGDRFVHTIT